MLLRLFLLDVTEVKKSTATSKRDVVFALLCRNGFLGCSRKQNIFSISCNPNINKQNKISGVSKAKYYSIVYEEIIFKMYNFEQLYLEQPEFEWVDEEVLFVNLHDLFQL